MCEFDYSQLQPEAYYTRANRTTKLLVKPVSDQTTQQQMDDLRQTVSQLSDAVGVLVTEFLQPLTKQALASQRSIAALIDRTDSLADAVTQHQEWLDEDRRDLASYRQRQEEQSQQIQVLIEADRRDRTEAARKFDETQAEIRQNQRLLLEGQRRAEGNEQRLDAILAEVLSLSRRVTAVEDAA